MLFMYLISPISAEKAPKLKGKIGNVWIEGERVFFTVCQGESPDLCGGVYLPLEHKLFQPAYTAVMNAKAMNHDVTVFGEPTEGNRLNFIKMLLP